MDSPVSAIGAVVVAVYAVHAVRTSVRSIRQGRSAVLDEVASLLFAATMVLAALALATQSMRLVATALLGFVVWPASIGIAHAHKIGPRTALDRLRNTPLAFVLAAMTTLMGPFVTGIGILLESRIAVVGIALMLVGAWWMILWDRTESGRRYGGNVGSPEGRHANETARGERRMTLCNSAPRFTAECVN